MMRNGILPIFLKRENKYPVGVAVFFLAAVLYMTSNHFHVFPPRVLPMSWVDERVPFLPSTVWVYATQGLFFAAVYSTCRDMVNLNKAIYSLLALEILSVAIFWIWPTTYPRDRFPLPHDLNSATYYFFDWLRKTDDPANCFPSLHVSGVFLASFIFLDEQREKFPFFFVWGCLLSASALTTKQHYWVDAVAGVLLAVAMFWIFHRYISYRV